MVGIEQFFQNLFLSNTIIMEELSKGKDDSFSTENSDVFIDSLPSFSDGISKHLPIILIRCMECRDSFFYDAEPHAYDATVNIGIGAESYERLAILGDLIKELMLEGEFVILDSDSFNDSVESMYGLSITFHNKFFMELHNK